ncbi:MULTISPECIES: dTDP-4-amino-4,6-dideoxy-D-galactose acyltransferase [Atlantibacter]|uniref:dTDP-4-amino-4,6-dideoxy-D-galactose acyltransferase n=1 Tax=Atlantibacter TaxID=1903434 RepID=UPI0022B79FBF|nr:dTDP-4-amino-4,6-dideoxy-D-galactose acyltransferase [Atlantibacter sp.]MCZ7836503.1 dTDP-4-amino-4,6-dideoxy-D-galactose acyltransferase [Atlantibacter hermannii]
MPVHASINPQEWESRFFGINTAILRLSDDAPVLDATQLTAWSRVQAKVPAQRTDWLDALQQLQFQLVEGEADFMLDVGIGNTDPGLQPAGREDIPALRAMAATLFANSRFRAPWYAPDASGRFYAQWVENAVNGSFDHTCLVLREDDGAIRGFVTLRRLNNSETRIGLLGGYGAGRILMDAARHWCEIRQSDVLRVATQMGNRAAIRRYIQSGATLDSAAYWLYR